MLLKHHNFLTVITNIPYNLTVMSCTDGWCMNTKKMQQIINTVDWPEWQVIETEGFNQAKIRRIRAKAI